MKTKTEKSNVRKETVNNNLCIGCGFCAAICPENAISMCWDKRQRWIAQVNDNRCIECGLCINVCINTPTRISEYARSAAEVGENFGLQDKAQYYVSYDMDSNKRILSAAGGSVSAILKILLEIDEIDGVIASVPVMAPVGNPHYELRIIRSTKELDRARSSHYYPLKYDLVLKEIKEYKGRYAIIGTPCIMRGVKKLPQSISKRIRYTFCLICSHNVTGQFLDCLAIKEGIKREEPFIANLRDKFGKIPDAANYNNYFKLSNREIRRNRFSTAFTDMWRNYFFTHECCLYCPDFYGVDADISAKDAWGRLSSDPLGKSLLVVRNADLNTILHIHSDSGHIYLEQCDSDEIFHSQSPTPRFKHIQIRDRLVWKKAIRKELVKSHYPLGVSRRIWKENSLTYWQFRVMMGLSNFFYSHWGRVPVLPIIKFGHIPNRPISIVKRLTVGIKKITSPMIYVILGFFKHPFTNPPRFKRKSAGKELRVLIAGGYGYQNAGDEAQLAAVVSQWKRKYPKVNLTILSPNPEYTEKTHGEKSELALRVILFDSNKTRDYGQSNFGFRWRFKWIHRHMLKITRQYLRGRPLIGAYPHEAHLLSLIAKADVLHLTGGGYLTGRTLSRLWDNMLLIRIADLLGKPVILSGQTIGIFRDRNSKRLASSGLKKAKLIYLRDPTDSIADINSLGIKGTHIKSTFDDALFCDVANEKVIDQCLKANKVVKGSYIVVIPNDFPTLGKILSNAEIKRVMKRIAEVCDYFSSNHNKQVLLLPLHPIDLHPIKEIKENMLKDSKIINYDYDYRITKGLISRADVCITMKHHGIIFAMGTAVPTISIALGDYYYRKNFGALSLFDQENGLITSKELFEKKLFEKKIDYFVRTLDKQRAIIVSILEKMKKQDGEIIEKFLKQYWK